MAHRMFPRKRCSRDHNKIIFRDELAAKIALAKRRDNNDRESVPRRAYKCEYANHYHLTSKKRVREDGKDEVGASVKSPQNAERIGRVARASWKAPSEGGSVARNETGR